MAKPPFDPQKIYHFVRDHPGWDMSYHEWPRGSWGSRLPWLHHRWLELRHHRRDLVVRINCDHMAVDDAIARVAATIEANPYVQPADLEQVGE